MVVTYLKHHQRNLWADYVRNHEHGTLYHLPQWLDSIQKVYGHRTYCLIASDGQSHQGANRVHVSVPADDVRQTSAIKGILPLVHIRHLLFGNSLISLPFCDLGGILADDEQAEEALLVKAIELGCELKVRRIEFRHVRPLLCLEGMVNDASSRFKLTGQLSPRLKSATYSDKVRMILPLQDSSEALMKSFRSKLRSQIKRPLKEGLTCKIGGTELLDDFYDVFLVNMRDLGSPVHSKKLLAAFLKGFSLESKIVAVYKGSKALAVSVVVGFKDTLSNPWASSLREYASLSPNMLLYWGMLEYACDHQYAQFDFGRSSIHESTYRFKEQWGAEARPLYWQYVALDGSSIENGRSEKQAFRHAIEYWKKLPVPFTKLAGPIVRRYIGL